MVSARDASEHIAEVTAGHHKAHRLGGSQPQAGVAVVDDLGHDPRPIDRIHRTQLMLRFKCNIAKDRFHDALTVVEGAFHREVVDILIQHRLQN